MIFYLQRLFLYAILFTVCFTVILNNIKGKGVCFVMKKGTHPKYEQTTVACACGTIIETGSTGKDIRVEVCSSCHPFYTGSRNRLVEKGGRVERFKKKYGMEG